MDRTLQPAMNEIFESRPFKVRNAEEYDLSSVFNLFVNPVNGLIDSFDYENSFRTYLLNQAQQ